MFESALLSGRSPSRRRSVSLSIAIAVHAAAVLGILGASLWREEEVFPPDPPITPVKLESAPPPAGSPSAATHRGPSSAVHTPEVVPREASAPLPSLAPPPDTGAAAPNGDPRDATDTRSGEPDGVPGGTGDTPNGIGAGNGPGVGAGDAPIVIGGDVRPPRLIERHEPDYPEIARKTRQEGVVILQAIIGAGGQVEDVQVLKSAFPLLDESAVRAVRRWRYRAATLDGRAVRVYLTVTVDFRLR